MSYTQLSDTELQEAVNFHRRQRNMSRGINEAAHMRQTQIVRLLEAEEARRLEEAKKPVSKDAVIKLLVKYGNNPETAKKITEKEFASAIKAHPEATASKIAEVIRVVAEEVELDENLGKTSKKMKFMFNTDPRDVKQRIKDASPEFRDQIRNTPGKLGGPAELQRRLARKMKEEVELDEATMTPTDMKQREKIVKGMKKSAQDFKDRYGSNWKSVMYATATKAAMNEEAELDK